jgi:hypothetical protein
MMANQAPQPPLAAMARLMEVELAPRTLLFEWGLGLDRQLKLLFDRSPAYDALEFVPDAAGAPRVVLARKKT